MNRAWESRKQSERRSQNEVQVSYLNTFESFSIFSNFYIGARRTKNIFSQPVNEWVLHTSNTGALGLIAHGSELLNTWVSKDTFEP